MMILLRFALSLFLVLRLSECALVVHNDCANYRALIDASIGKAQSRTYALYQEMSLLSSASTNVQGNAGLARAAAYLFDPLISFYTVAQSCKAVAASLLIDLNTGGYVPGLTNVDTIVRCSGDGLTQLRSGDWIDENSLSSLGNFISQDSGNVVGCFPPAGTAATLKTYVTVPPVELNMPSIIRICPGFLQSEYAITQTVATNPDRMCRDLYSPNPQQLLRNSNAKTVVDLAVAEDPYYEWQRAILQIAPSGLNNGGLSRFRTSNILRAFRSQPTDGWQAWRNNLASNLVVPAAVAALSTLLDQQRYCFQRPVADGTFQPSPRNQQTWITWHSSADYEWFLNRVVPAGA